MGVTPAIAGAIAEAACERVLKGIDLVRLSRTYYESSDAEERTALVKLMSESAVRSKEVRVAEIARHLKVSRVEAGD